MWEDVHVFILGFSVVCALVRPNALFCFVYSTTINYLFMYSFCCCIFFATYINIVHEVYVCTTEAHVLGAGGGGGIGLCHGCSFHVYNKQLLFTKREHAGRTYNLYCI